MARRNQLLRFLLLGVIGLVLARMEARGQALRLDAIPTGVKPLGIDVIHAGVTDVPSGASRVFSLVANSGSNSVTVLELNFDLLTRIKSVTVAGTVSEVATPYAVASCGTALAAKVVVSSPASNSILVVQVPELRLLGKVNVGPQPHSVACFTEGLKATAVVSNAGDNSLSIVDLTSFTETARISDVPASRGLHGVFAGTSSTGSKAAVAGTDADVVTLVDLVSQRILARIPVRRPTAVRCCYAVASAADNTIIAINGATLGIDFIIRDIPNPQDFDGAGFGFIASVGGSNSIAQFFGNRVTTISGIPGAAGVQSFSWTRSPNPDSSVVLVTSPDSNTVFLVQQQPSGPHEFSTSNGASFGGVGLAPGSLASAFAPTGVIQNLFATSLPLPTTLGGATLRVGGKLELVNFRWTYSAEGSTPAPLLFVGPNQINFQLPPGTNPGDAVPLQLTKADGTTLLSTLRVVAASPGIFTVLMNGQGQAAALNQDNSQNGNPQIMLGARPAARGSVIQIFATGAGATNPPLGPGEAAPASGNPLVLTQVQPTVTMGGKNARVLFSGLAPGFVGLWQINAEIPADVTPGVAVPLVITAGGVPSNIVTIAVQ